MKEVKVRIVDADMLELLEDASRGDRINLRSNDGVIIDKSQIEGMLAKEIESAREKAIKQERERVLAEFSARAKTEQAEAELARQKLLFDLEIERNKLAVLEKSHDEKMQVYKAQQELEMNKIAELHNRQIEQLERERDLWKEHQHMLSIKDFGNELEEYCDDEFAKIANFLPHATFAKDTGGATMGDRIYREVDENGEEVLSIMFEMKKERADSRTKQKNAGFLPKLDSDRKHKECEYAVLVSLLEPDNKLYDSPVLVREFEKMFVIRPQHFRYIIENLRHMKHELKSANYAVAQIKKQNLDVTNFAKNWSEYLTGVGYNIKRADKHFAELRASLVRERDEKQKQIDELDLVGKNLNMALKKAEKVDFQKMAKDSPSLLLQFSEAVKTGTKKTS